MSQFTAKQAYQNATSSEKLSDAEYRNKSFDTILKVVEIQSVQGRLYYVANVTTSDPVKDSNDINLMVKKFEKLGFDVTVTDKGSSSDLLIVWKHAK